MALSESDRPAPDSDSHSATVLLAIAELSIILIITHHVF